jgi:conjugative relaxase-like TrwC/TraI family protein
MMTPSRIRSAAGASSYYGKDDYYVTGEAGAPGMTWGGEGAKALGLTGQAKTEDFQALLSGKNPDPDGPALSSAANKEKHHAGWDFTFTVPKSVSLAIVAAERSDPALAERLQEDVMAANKAMMGYLEKNHAYTRVRGEGGAIEEVQTGNLVYGSVLHRTTRGGDPHFHVHNPTANATQYKVGDEVRWGALETKHAYKWVQVASQVGARELQSRLMDEGFDIERKGELKWEIAGANPKLIEAFSTRSAEIEKAAGQLANDRNVAKLTPEQRNMIQKQTRKDKQAHDREAMSDSWVERAATVGGASLDSLLTRGRERGQDVTPTLQGQLSPALQAIRKVYRQLTGEGKKTDPYAGGKGAEQDPKARELMSFGVRVVEEQSAVNSKHRAFLKALQAAPAGLTFDRLEAALERLTGDGHVVRADGKRADEITTRKTLESERAILAAVEKGKGAARPILDQGGFGHALNASPTAAKLNADQRSALEGFFTSQDRFRAITGFAGVGKTFTFSVARDVMEKQKQDAFAAAREIANRSGQELYGLSSMNAHVKELRAGAGLQAQTIASWLIEVERATRDPSGAKLTAAREKWGSKHLIVDEASTVTNDTGLRIVRAVEALGVKSVTFAGDTGQTGGPGAGNPFKAMLDRGIEQMQINTILRQQNAPDHLREGVRDLAEGRLREGMAKMAPHIHALGKDANDVDLARTAVGLWSEQRQAGRETVLIVATNKMRALQSNMARAVLREEGVLVGVDETRERLTNRHMTKAEQFAAGSYQLGDVLVFNEAFKGRGPTRGERATVVGIDAENNLLRLQGDGAPKFVDLTREQRRDWSSFSTYSMGTHEVAKGERLVWEARFKDRGYERGAEFQVVEKGAKSWTIEHGDGRRETLSAKDPALAFTSHAYAITTERAQGRSIEAPIATMESRAGQAVAENKNYVNWSRLTKLGEMVTDDLPRVMQMLAQNDGKKPVALDHIATAFDQAKAEARKAVLERGGETKDPKQPDRELDLNKSLDMPGSGSDRQKGRTRTPEVQIARNGPGLGL